MASFIFLDSPSPTHFLPNLPMPLPHRTLSSPAPARTLMDCSTCLSPPDCAFSDYCRTFCVDIYLDPLDCSPKPHKFHPSLLLAILLLSVAFLLVSSFVLYLRYCCNRRSSSSSHGSGSRPFAEDEFLDMDVEPILDHPVWYINTVGLRPSVITSITVCNYKRGDGLVEGTDCSICLNEFRDGETLRLLPKCSHAFHIPCIDTWLLSHTSCPMCRAGIVFGSGRVSVSDIAMEIPQDGRDGGVSQHEVVVSEISDSLEEGIGPVNMIRRGGSGNVKEVGDNGVKIVRRSVSMDCMFTSRLCPAFANLTHLESSLNSSANSTADTRSEEFPMGNWKKGAACSHRFRDCYFMESMQQPGPSLMTRSSSCGAKLFLQRYGRS